MTECTSYQEFTAKYQANTVITGMYQSTETILPCPVCAEPNWLTLPLDNTRELLEAETQCAFCMRTFKAIFSADESITAYQIVQTAGDDPPDWMNGLIPRVWMPPEIVMDDQGDQQDG